MATTRLAPGPKADTIECAVGLFLDLAVSELERQRVHPEEPVQEAQAGYDLSLPGLTVVQIAHGCSDLCQLIVELAIELEVRVSADDLIALDQCLDDTIAGAVTEQGRWADKTGDGQLQELRNFANTATAAFAVLREGRVGIRSPVGDVLEHSLVSIRGFLDRPLDGK